MSSFVGLYTGLSGIRAAQTGIDVTSNNVANANTPGYTRQRVELRASHSYQAPAGRLGTGVTVESIARLRDVFLDDRYRTAVGDAGSDAVRAELLAGLESLSGEPDEGLSVRIDRLWPAAEAWANDPNDLATRRQVLTELSSIADGFRATAAAWDRLGEDAADRRGTVLDLANDTLQTLHELNQRIANADPKRIGPDLLDQRDQLLDELAELTGATSRIQPDGSVTVSLGTTELLSFPDGAATLSIDDGPDPDTIVATLPDSSVVDVTPATTGELGGLHHVLIVDLPQWRGELDAMAAQLADAINAVNEGGRRADGSAGVELLSYTPGDAASTIALATTDLADLAAAEGPAPGPAPEPHDGSNARALADLRTTRLGAGGTPDPGGRTLEGQLADLTVGLAGAVRSAKASAKAAGGVATGASLARAAEHGVSLDEEMVGLVRYQRALEASARVMTTIDQALEVLVNRVGIVGR